MKISPLAWSLAIVGSISMSALAGDSKNGEIDNQYPTLAPQTRCPVMGGKIDSAYYTDIQGQRIYHCCNGCSTKLTDDPDTYLKKAATEGVLFENIQTKCPVNGKPIDRTIFVDYQGRRVYFAKEKCMDKFAKDPAKYLAKLDKQTHEHDKDNAKENHDSHQGGHGGHGGGCGM
ncbi:MAG: YHS domain-containing protein [Candidatus Zixiibacteriota bacterium]